MKTIEQVKEHLIDKLLDFRNIREIHKNDECAVRVYSSLRNYCHEILDFIESEEENES